MLHVEKQPVEAGHRHGLGDLDAARDAHADAERQLALFELFAGDVADGGGHWRFLLGIEHGVLAARLHPAGRKLTAMSLQPADLIPAPRTGSCRDRLPPWIGVRRRSIE